MLRIFAKFQQKLKTPSSSIKQKFKLDVKTKDPKKTSYKTKRWQLEVVKMCCYASIPPTTYYLINFTDILKFLGFGKSANRKSMDSTERYSAVRVDLGKSLGRTFENDVGQYKIPEKSASKSK